ncbi:MAG: ATP-binding protein [Desulfobacterales bacterium]|nr:ATP-binding protein [Desulfobacterales bacterium]
MTTGYARILDTLCRKTFKDSAIAWFITDLQGSIRHWGGSFSRLNLPEPAGDSQISDLLVFLEGMIPLEDEELEFSFIELPSGICVDACIYRQESSLDIIIWDSSRKQAHLRPTLQVVNEMSLLIEQKEKQLADLDPGQEQTGFLVAFFAALNVAVLEMDTQGRFFLFSQPPSWLDSLPQAERLRSGSPLEEDYYSFLGNFIQDAKSRWEQGQKETFGSGLWIEEDDRGEELLFEASALAVQGRRLLIISKDACLPDEKQAIIQKGRDLALHYDNERKSGRQLRSLNDILELRVRERTRELESVNQQLSIELKERKRAEAERTEALEQLRQSQKMEAIGTLAGGVAHDFNNILSGIIGYTELSLVEDGESEKLDKILNAAYRARNLVKQILTFSHQTNQDREPVMLSRVVNEAVGLATANLPANINVDSDLKSNAYILADSTQIHQVVMNLCTNAWQAMAEGGGMLSVGLQETEIDEKRHLLLTIKDTGPGIPADLMEKVFDPYFTTKEEGNGLGLSVVQGIVRKSDGYIEVDTAADKGTEFRIVFPVWDLRADR